MADHAAAAAASGDPEVRFAGVAAEEGAGHRRATGASVPEEVREACCGVWAWPAVPPTRVGGVAQAKQQRRMSLLKEGHLKNHTVVLVCGEIPPWARPVPGCLPALTRRACRKHTATP